jgi:hypothetical protein
LGLFGFAAEGATRWDFYGSLRAAVFGQVSEATVTIVERPWERVVVDGKPHSHGEQDYRLSFLS